MIYGVPVGCDFVKEAVAGLRARHPDPLALAQVQIVVNGTRFARRLREELTAQLRILPKVLTIDQLCDLHLGQKTDTPDENRTEEVLLLAKLLETLEETTGQELFEFGYRFEIAHALLDLLDQTVERELTPTHLLELNVEDFAEHWRLNSQFFQILAGYWESAKHKSKIFGDNARIANLAELWASSPISQPIYVIGSTGSRPIMRKLMNAVILNPYSGIVIPSVDFEQIEMPPMEHPQFGARDLCTFLKFDEIDLWSGAPKAFGQFVSVALAPAPQTDHWRKEMPSIKNLLNKVDVELTLVEADSTYEEARVIAIRIHNAVQEKHKVALVSADRVLVRSVCHLLDHLNVIYDDSSGTPLALSPEGLFAKLLLNYFERPSPTDILPLLAHPQSASSHRVEHLQNLRVFDEQILRRFPGLNPWSMGANIDNAAYIEWSKGWKKLFQVAAPEKQTLSGWINWHLNRCADFSFQELSSLTGGFFDRMRQLASSVKNADPMSINDYKQFWNAWIAREKSVDGEIKHEPDVKILGMIEARAESADVIIHAGMNEGYAPSATIPDMWLNRSLRKELGLETPERFVGLAAHDFLSGLACDHWLITRSRQQGGAQAVESRFVTRVKTLLNGASSELFEDSLERGRILTLKARKLNLPVAQMGLTKRPAISLDNQHKPRTVSVTQIEKFVGNPYHFYVEKVLGLRPMQKIQTEITPMVKGEIWHAVFENLSEDFVKGKLLKPSELNDAFKLQMEKYDIQGLTKFNLEYDLSTIESQFNLDENLRRDWASEILNERQFEIPFATKEGDVTLKARVDRIDQDDQGGWNLYDYKSGSSAPYSNKEFVSDQAQQLPITSVILRAAGYAQDPEEIAVLRYKDKSGVLICPLKDIDIDQYTNDLSVFFDHYFDQKRPWHINPSHAYANDVNHLARFGEWLGDEQAEIVEVTS